VSSPSVTVVVIVVDCAATRGVPNEVGAAAAGMSGAAGAIEQAVANAYAVILKSVRGSR
jgi:hypothetical protein